MSTPQTVEEATSPGDKIVVIGGSAGALAVLERIVERLPRDIPASFFVVLHLSPSAPSKLADILARRGGPRVLNATDYAAIDSSTIYVAQSDHHLQIVDGRMELGHGPRENRSRPAIDPLFRSAARWYGDQVIAVLLSGMLDDGVAGLQAVKQAGGVVIVLDPAEATFPQMPENAIRYDSPDYVLGCDEIAGTIERLSQGTVAGTGMNGKKQQPDNGAKPSGYICPDCGGSLSEIDEEGDLPKFRCRVGHAYSLRALVAAENDALEGALWAAVRSLEENAALKKRTAASQRTETRVSKRLQDDADALLEHAKLIRETVLDKLKAA